MTIHDRQDGPRWLDRYRARIEDGIATAERDDWPELEPEPDPTEWEDFVRPGQTSQPVPKLPEWHGWPIPNRVALVAAAGAGKSTILADVAAWYAGRGKRVLVAAAEALDEWLELTRRYPLEHRPTLYDWERHAPGRSPASYRHRWDAILVDPGIAALTLYELDEDRNGSIRQLMTRHVYPALTPGGHVWLAWHVGHQATKRGRGQSDLRGWARLAMLYDRQEGQDGVLSKIKANRYQDAYKPLTVRLDGQGRPEIEAGGQDDMTLSTPRDSERHNVLNYIRDHPHTTATEIAEALNMARPTVYSQVAKLEQDGAVIGEKQGRAKLLRVA